MMLLSLHWKLTEPSAQSWGTRLTDPISLSTSPSPSLPLSCRTWAGVLACRPTVSWPRPSRGSVPCRAARRFSSSSYASSASAAWSEPWRRRPQSSSSSGVWLCTFFIYSFVYLFDQDSAHSLTYQQKHQCKCTRVSIKARISPRFWKQRTVDKHNTLLTNQRNLTNRNNDNTHRRAKMITDESRSVVVL